MPKTLSYRAAGILAFFLCALLAPSYANSDTQERFESPPTPPMPIHDHRLPPQLFIASTIQILVCPDRISAVKLVPAMGTASEKVAIRSSGCKSRQLYGRIENVLDRRLVKRADETTSTVIAFTGYQHHAKSNDLPFFGVVSEPVLNDPDFTAFELWQKNFAPVRGIYRHSRSDAVVCLRPATATQLLAVRKIIDTNPDDRSANVQMKRLLATCPKAFGNYRPVALLAQWQSESGRLLTAIEARSETGKTVGIAHYGEPPKGQR